MTIINRGKGISSPKEKVLKDSLSELSKETKESLSANLGQDLDSHASKGSKEDVQMKTSLVILTSSVTRDAASRERAGVLR
jgi:hypothetical protein